MLSNLNKIISVNATSIVNDIEAVGFNCQINEDKRFSIYKDIRDYKTYVDFKEVCEKDYGDFEHEITKILVEQ